MDLALKQKVDQVISKRDRRFVKASDAMAVIDHESHGVPIFKVTDQQYKDNLHEAQKITGMSADDIRKAVNINYGVYINQCAKFRCEPGYWAWAKQFSGKMKPEDVFLLSCSIGLGQKMMRWYVSGLPQKDWSEYMHHFLGSTNEQIAYVVGDLDQLLVLSHGDKALAFTRYNAGPNADIKSAAYEDYGQPVAAQAARFQSQISGDNTHV